MSLQLVPTQELLDELARRYPHFLASFVIHATAFEAGRMCVFSKGEVHVTLGLAEYAKVVASKAAVENLRPGNGVF